MNAWLTKSQVSSCLLLLSLVSHAQLAITEVMSETRDSARWPDYWELTNFGSSPIPLDGFTFSDNRPSTTNSAPFENLTIGPNESVIFVRDNRSVTNELLFFNWWPSAPRATQVRFYDVPGLDGDQYDELWLRDPNGNVVDHVKFFGATFGTSFVCDPQTGDFGHLSAAGADCASLASTGDIGSPGCTSGSIPLAIITQPQNQVLAGCGQAVLRVQAAGLPRPKYKWFRDNVPIPGESEESLRIPLLQEAAVFKVELDNGLTKVTSENATLVVDQRPLPPLITAAPEDVYLYPGQRARFHVEARALPCPAYQWATNGADIPGATSASIEIPVPHGSLMPAVISVTVMVSNQYGVSFESARLIVDRPELIITEIEANPASAPPGGTAGKDWFELSNIGTNSINLKGYRISEYLSFEGAFRITNDISVGPGEAVVLVEALSPALFKRWWGEDRFPPELKIITFSRFALGGLSGGMLYIYNAAADDTQDVVSGAGYLSAIQGISCEYQGECDETGCTSVSLGESVAGSNAAYFAPENRDVGSPGIFSRPLLTSIVRNGNAIQFRGRGIQSRLYSLEQTMAFGAHREWAPASEGFVTPDFDSMFSIGPVSLDSGTVSQFFRLKEIQ